MKKALIIFLILFSCLWLRAQQELGIQNSNYAGIQGALLNPSVLADSKLKWDINILSVDETFDNNFLYAPRKSLNFLGFKKIIKGSIDEDLFTTHYDPQEPAKLYNVTFAGEALGPSFFLTLPQNQAVGFTMSARASAGARDITGSLAQNLFDYFLGKDLWNTELHDNTTKIDVMGWLEYGIHYARVLYKSPREELTGGVSLNYLMGNYGAYLKNTHINYKITDSANFIFSNSSLDYGRTDLNRYGNFNNGRGVGADIGFTYLRLKGDEKKYLYRIALSLLDLGGITYRNNATAYHLQADSADLSNWHQLKFSSNTEFDRTVSAFFYGGDSSKSHVANYFRMGLPTSISVQADWNVYRMYYVNATIIKGFGHSSGQGAIRPDVYSITPRYETKWIDVGLPVSIIYYGRLTPRLGIAVRYRYFFIGGDAPGSLLKLHDLQGVDFYTGIRFFIPESR